MSGGAGMAGAAPVVDTRRSRLSDGVDDDWRCCDTAAMPWHTRAGHLPPERVGGQSPERKKSRAVAAISGVGEAEASDARPVAGARKPARFSVFDQEDCVTPVLQHLEVGHVTMLSQVSRLLRRACDSHELWAGFCLRDFGQDSHKIMNVYEAAELTGSSGRVCSGSVVAGHVLCRGIQYKHLYRKMLAYEIELHFVSGPMGTPIIKVVNDEAAGRCRTPMTVAGAQEDAAARDEEHHKSRAVSIGRSRQNDISILQDEMVSRKHGEIYREGVLYLFRDVGSINGTFINAEPVKLDPVVLHVDDKVEMGATKFLVRISPPIHDSLRGSWKDLGHVPQGSTNRNKVQQLADGQDCLASAHHVFTHNVPAAHAHGGSMSGN